MNLWQQSTLRSANWPCGILQSLLPLQFLRSPAAAGAKNAASLRGHLKTSRPTAAGRAPASRHCEAADAGERTPPQSRRARATSGSAGASEVRVTLRADLSVDDHVSDVHAAWAELAGHALHHGAQAELWRREAQPAKQPTRVNRLHLGPET